MLLNDRILAVDDNADNLLILEELLGEFYTVRCASSGEEALRIAPDFRPDLVLLDVMMPGLNGIQTCRLLHEHPTLRDVKVVMLSARTGLDARLKSYCVGAVDYISKPFDSQEVLAKVRAWMQMVFKDEVHSLLQEAEATRDVVGDTLVSLAGFRDTETGGHLFRMRWYSQTLAEQLAVDSPYRAQIDEPFLRRLYRASPLHDIGKVAIDDAILRKPGPLTSDEFNTMKRHTVVGHEILSAAAERLCHADYLEMAAEIALHHHEWYDGSGYPSRLSGQRIPLAARIVAVADVFDALSTERVYKRAIPFDQSVRIIELGAKTQFDPAIVAALLLRAGDFEQALLRFSDGELMSRETDLIGTDIEDTTASGWADHLEYMQQCETASSTK